MSQTRHDLDRQQLLFVANVFHQLLSLQFKQVTARHVDPIRDIERVASLSTDETFKSLSSHLSDTTALLYRLDNLPAHASVDELLQKERNALENQMSTAIENKYITAGSVQKLKPFLPMSEPCRPDALLADQVVFCLAASKLMMGLYVTGDLKSPELEKTSRLFNKYLDDVAKKQAEHKLSTQALGAINSVLVTNLKSSLATLALDTRNKDLLQNLCLCAERADKAFQALPPENKHADVVMSWKLIELLNASKTPSVATQSFLKPEGKRPDVGHLAEQEPVSAKAAKKN